MTLTREELAVAYHEAGHAITAHELGLFVEGISVERRFLTEGDADIVHDEDATYIKVLYAGKEAHLRHAPNEVDDAAAGAAHDYAEAQRIAKDLGLSTKDLELLRLEAKAILENRWPWVERLVQELDVRRTIDWLHSTPSKLEEVLADITGKRVVDPRPPSVDPDQAATNEEK